MLLPMMGTTKPPVPSRAGKAGEAGLSGVAGLIAVGLGLLLVALLTLVGTGTFSSGSGGGSPLLGHSRAEEQLQLCVEGRPSVYGNPPSPSQQAACTRELAGQAAGDGGPGVSPPLPTTTTTLIPGFSYPTG
jgi:hypothetical protein